MGKISTWNKWDLHLHTRASNKFVAHDYFGAGNEFGDSEIISFVDSIFTKSGPILVAITDHNYFNAKQFISIKEKVINKSRDESRQINVLPGAELDIVFQLNDKEEAVTNPNHYSEEGYHESKICHCIIIINDDNFGNKNVLYDKFEEILTKHYSIKKPVYIEKILFDLIEAKFEFILMPHFTKEPGLESAVPDSSPIGAKLTSNMELKTHWILMGYFPILDGCKNDFLENRVNKFYQNIKAKTDIDIPIVLTSDNHDYRSYSNEHISFYKSLPTFKGLKMCLSDYEQRVANIILPKKPAFISKIEIRNKGENDVVEECDISLSENLNCIIGGRSSGKSLLLKELVFSLNPDEVKKDLQEYKKYHEKFEIRAYDADGKHYFGKPEYFSQGSIISKFDPRNINEGLKDDFKEYFPQSVNTKLVEAQKQQLVVSIIEFMDELAKSITIKNEVSSINIMKYLTLPKKSAYATLSSQQMTKDIESARVIVNNMNAYIDVLERYKPLISQFPSLLIKHNELLSEAKSIQTNILKKFDVYTRIGKITSVFIENSRKSSSEEDRRYKDMIDALYKKTSSIIEYCRKNDSIDKALDSIRTILSQLDISKNESNEIGHHKFEIRLQNTLTITSLLDVIKDFVKTKELKQQVNFKAFVSKALETGYEVNSSKNLQQMLHTAINDALKIDYLIYERNELINEMSEGRKVGVFLDILLNRSGSIEPLIIDQPEDDMDNAAIFSTLVNTLRNLKTNRQILLATHDANIVVNGDSENVIYAKKDKRVKVVYKNGALEYEDDSLIVQKIICETLEGGEKAFTRRADKYGIDKLQLYKWGE